MKQKAIMAIALLALVSMMIIPVSAVPEYTGTETTYGASDNVKFPTYYGADTGTSAAWNQMEWITDVSISGTPESLIFYSSVDYSLSGSSPFRLNVTSTGQTYATGTMYCQNGTLMYGANKQYWYLVFDSWNITGLSGVVQSKITATGWTSYYNPAYGLFYAGDKSNIDTTVPMGFRRVGMGSWMLPSGGAIYTKVADSVKYDYQFTKVSGSGAGQITNANVTRNANTITNKIVVKNATTGSNLYASTAAVISGTENFVIVGAPFRLSSYIGTSYYNGSAIFYPAVVPTPTPTGAPTGQIRTYVQNVDGVTSGQIHNSNLMIRDVESNAWTNWTNDLDGTGYIDTYSSHTIDAYGTATGYTSYSRLNLTPFDGVYELIMFPTGYFLDPGAGNVNLAVLVNDKQTASALTSASVSVTIPSGATIGGSTGSAGTETFVVPNNSVIHVTASKAGYLSGTKTLTTSNFGPDTIRIELTRATVTPTITSTPLPGEVTARPTIDARTGNQKDAAMMDIIRNNGESLITLAIIVTFVSLIGLLRKGM